MTPEDIKAWADFLREKYGIPYAIDMLTAEEETAGDHFTD